MTKKSLAVFDLDKTLTIRDTYLLYLFTALKTYPTRIFRCIVLPIHTIAFLCGFRGNAWLKERFLGAVLAGRTISEIQRINEQFLHRLLKGGMNHSTLDLLEHHRNKGDRLVLLSASLDLYVNDIGNALGFDQILATRAEVSEDVLTGKLAGPNLKGPEKVRALKSLLGNARDDLEITAYGDHKSDVDLLGWVDHGFWINRTAALERLATAHSIGFV